MTFYGNIGAGGPHGGGAKPKPTKEELLGDKIDKHRANAVIAGFILAVPVGIAVVIVVTYLVRH